MKRTAPLLAVALALLAFLALPATAPAAVDRTLVSCEPEIDVAVDNAVVFVFPQDRHPVSGSFTLSGIATCAPSDPVNDPWTGVQVDISGSGRFYTTTCVEPEPLALVGTITATPRNGEPAFSASLGVNMGTTAREKSLGRMSVGGASAKRISMRLPGMGSSCGSMSYGPLTIVAEEDFYLDDAPPNDGVPDPSDAALQGDPMTADAGDSFRLSPGESVSDMPQWVFELPTFGAIITEGVPLSKVTFFESGAAITEAHAYSGCPRQHMCLYQHSKYRGRRLQFYPGGWNNLSDYGFNDRTSSWRNRRRLAGALYQHRDGGGNRICNQRYSLSAHMGSFNDKASSIYLNHEDPRCGI